MPLATEGALEYTAGGGAKRVRITRVHMEEDAGKSLHEGFADSDRKTYLDFNRSGTPLIEIVTEPDLRSAGDAADAFRKLRDMLIALGVNDGNMEEGSLRCDANVSVRPAGATTLGTKTEVKNINSFRYLEKALEYEIARQIAVLERGGTIVQETRLWDASTRETFSMRSKEDAHDYRYFPEPDLPPVRLARERVEEIRGIDHRAARSAAGARDDDVRAVRRRSDGAREYRADGAVRRDRQGLGQPRAAFNWVSGEVARKLNELGERFDRQRREGRRTGRTDRARREGNDQRVDRKGRVRENVRQRPRSRGNRRGGRAGADWRRRRAADERAGGDARRTRTRSRRFAAARPARSASSSVRS